MLTLYAPDGTAHLGAPREGAPPGAPTLVTVCGIRPPADEAASWRTVENGTATDFCPECLASAAQVYGVPDTRRWREGLDAAHEEIAYERGG